MNKQIIITILLAFFAATGHKPYVYGDSRGDDELLSLADEGFRIGCHSHS